MACRRDPGEDLLMAWAVPSTSKNSAGWLIAIRFQKGHPPAVDYRDWGRGDVARRERQPTDACGDPFDMTPGESYRTAVDDYRTAVDDYRADDEGYRTGNEGYRVPGQLRAVHRRGAESANRYLPPWAREPDRDPRPVSSGGRHRDPASEEDAAAPEARGRRGRQESATETSSRWERATEASSWWERATETTGRRPTSSADSGRHATEAGGYPSEPDEVASHSGAWRRATDHSWSSPPDQDNPSRSPWRTEGTERRRAREVPRSGTDQMDSTRLTARWVSDGPTDDRPGRGRDTDGGRWSRPADTGPWDRFIDTAQWERPPEAFFDEEPPSRRSTEPAHDPYADTGQWDRFTDTGQWARFTDTTEWTRGQVYGAGRQGYDGMDDHPGYDEGETFWSGTRLAGDDPRWMDTPVSAPRSPVGAYPNPARTRPTSGTARRTAPDATWRRSTSITARRPEPATDRRGRGRRLEDDLLPGDRGGYSATLLYTTAWYAIPVLALFIWLVTLDGSVPPNCVTDIAGGGCESPRLHALTSLLGGASQFGAAFAASLVVATLLRRVISTWRARSIGLAAAVVGGGVSTVVFSALSNQPLN
jgi:hypothetical protein